MPLSDVGSPVTGNLKNRGQQRLLKEQTGLGFSIDVAVDAKPLLILTGQQTHPRGHADWGRNIGIGEESAFISKSIDIRSWNFGLTKFRQVGVAHVIGEDEDDIWLRHGACDVQIVALIQPLDFIELVAELPDNRGMAFPEIYALEGIC